MPNQRFGQLLSGYPLPNDRPFASILTSARNKWKQLGQPARLRIAERVIFPNFPLHRISIGNRRVCGSHAEPSLDVPLMA